MEKKLSGPKKHSMLGRKNPNAGRKLFDGKPEYDVIQKLEQVFAIDGTDEEACSYADISTQALYAYQKKNLKFLERKRRLKERPVLKARQIVMQKMSESYANAMDYLKRKRKTEFSERHEHTGEDGSAINLNISINGATKRGLDSPSLPSKDN